MISANLRLTRHQVPMLDFQLDGCFLLSHSVMADWKDLDYVI